MKQIIVNTQAELDAIKKVEIGEEVIIKASLRLGIKLEVLGTIIFETSIDTSWDDRYLIAPTGSQPQIEARGSSQPRIIARGSSQPRIIAWESSQPRIIAWESSQPRIEARESSQPRIEARGSSQVQGIGIEVDTAIVKLFGYAVLTTLANLKIKVTKTKKSIWQKVKHIDWFENNAIEKKKKIILFKRVSKDFKTQEGQLYETTWTIGKTLEHPDWKPELEECNGNKFHACSWPYFCDDFRDIFGDRYIAIEIALKDTYAWPNPQYPHKIAFRRGKVLWEVDRYGEKITEQKNGK
jgi:hypothetical protein